VRPLLVGLAMGAMAVLLIYSPWGKQSGAHREYFEMGVKDLAYGDA
jgi:hypothetical protein